MGTPGTCTLTLPSLLSIKREQTSHRYQSRCQGDLESVWKLTVTFVSRKKKPVILTVIKQQCLEIAQTHLTVGQH